MQDWKKPTLAIAKIIGYLFILLTGVMIVSEGLDDGTTSDAGRYLTALPIYLLLVLVFERRAIREFSPLRGLIELPAGLLGGAALMALTLVPLLVAGRYLAESSASLSALGEPFFHALEVGLFEELICRAIVLRLMLEFTSRWWALGVSSLLFALPHAGNPGASGPALFGAFVAGLLFGSLYILTSRMWVPVGVHAGWNFALGSLFGLSVSGLQHGSFVKGRVIGHEWITGGTFGLEASVPCLVVLSAITIHLLWRVRKVGISPLERGDTQVATSPPHA